MVDFALVQEKPNRPQKLAETPDLVASLTEALTKGTYECMVCMDKIGRKAQVLQILLASLLCCGF